MNEINKTYLINYLTTIHHIKNLFKLGLISKKDYDNFDTIIAKKYGLSSCSIFRENP